MKRAKFKIALATALVLFDLFSCFAGTYAWFTAARTNEAASMQVQMYTHELDMSYKVYKYDDDLGAAINATGRPDALILKEYDSGFELGWNGRVVLTVNQDWALGHIDEFLLLIRGLLDHLETNRKRMESICRGEKV